MKSYGPRNFNPLHQNKRDLPGASCQSLSSLLFFLAAARFFALYAVAPVAWRLMRILRSIFWEVRKVHGCDKR